MAFINTIANLPGNTFPEVGEDGLVAEPVCRKSVNDSDDAINCLFSSKFKKSKLLLLCGVTMATAGDLVCVGGLVLGDKGFPEGGTTYTPPLTRTDITKRTSQAHHFNDLISRHNTILNPDNIHKI